MRKFRFKNISLAEYKMALDAVVDYCKENRDLAGERYAVYMIMANVFYGIETDDIVDRIYSEHIVDDLLKEKQARDFYDDAMRAMAYMHNESQMDKVFADIVNGDGSEFAELVNKLNG